MPPKFKFTREEIISSAVELVRCDGMEALSARNLATALGSSPKPIFGLFEGMCEVRDGVIKYASSLYESYIKEDMESGKYPPYKGSGMAYVRFAREENNLFKLLFMRDRTGEKISDGKEDLRPLINIIMENTGLDEERAYLLHLEMWIYLHGIATMIANSYLEWDESFISETLTHIYTGVRDKLREESSNGSN